MRPLTFVLAVCVVCAQSLFAQQSARCNQTAVDTAIGSETVRLYLSPIRVDSAYRLTPNGYSGGTHVEHTLNFGESRDSADTVAAFGVPRRAINTRNGVQFVSPPLAGPFDLRGSFSGRLELVTNKPGFDFQISLYEITPTGDYVLVSNYSTQSPPPGEAHHSPLQPGIRQYREYQSGCFAGRLIQNGSRLLVMITIFNRGRSDTASVGGVAVRDGTDGEPELLKVAWYGNSYIELRVRHH